MTQPDPARGDSPTSTGSDELAGVPSPQPSPGFRADLKRRLTAQDPGWGARPERLWTQAVALLIAGVALLLIGALISTGGI